MSSRFALGALCIVVTVILWSGWYVVIRLGLTSSQLNVQDLAALRFGVAGILHAAGRVEARAGARPSRLARPAGDRAGRRRAVRPAGRRRAGLCAGLACQRDHAGHGAARGRRGGGFRARGAADGIAPAGLRPDRCRRGGDRRHQPGSRWRAARPSAMPSSSRRPSCGRATPSRCARRTSWASMRRRSPPSPR